MSDNYSNPEDEYRITDPVDLVGAIPYLLGYRVPERSLVVIGFHGPRLACTFRTELTPFGADVYDDLAVRLRRNDCTAVIMICFGGQPLAEAAEAVATAALDAEGIAIGDALRVTGEHLWCLKCTNCPRQGLEVPETTPAGIALAVHGRTVAPDRDAVLQRLDPIGGPRAADVAAALYDAQRHWARLSKDERAHAAVERFDTAFIAQPDALAAEPEIIADLLVAMADVRTRVLAYRQIAPAIARDCLETWLIAARLASGTDTEAAALCVAGYCAYQAGEGFLAAEAFERARKADESCMDAWAYLDAYHQGIPPTQVEVFAPLGDA
jgi:hypothetical protein